MILLLVGHCGFLSRCGRKGEHVALGRCLLGLYRNATGGCEHTSRAVAAAEAGVEEHHYRVGSHVAEIGVEFSERYAAFRHHCVTVDGQQECILGAFIGHSVSGIVEYDIGVAVDRLDNVAYVGYGTQHLAEGGILVDADVLLGNAEG